MQEPNKQSAMVSRLRKNEPQAKNEEGIEQTKPENRPASILTPTYTEDPVSKPRNDTFAYIISTEESAKLPEILAQASPFVSPLSITQLVELVYREMRRSPKLLARIQTAFIPSKWLEDWNKTLAKQKKTSLKLSVEVIDYLTSNLRCNARRALTYFISWIVSDWDWLCPRINHKGADR